VPGHGEPVRLDAVKRERSVAVDMRLLQGRYEDGDVHGISPGVWLDAGCGKPADTERGRHYARGGERLPAFLRQKKNCVVIERHKG
jgi:hypothetical protein